MFETAVIIDTDWQQTEARKRINKLFEIYTHIEERYEEDLELPHKHNILTRHGNP